MVVIKLSLIRQYSLALLRMSRQIFCPLINFIKCPIILKCYPCSSFINERKEKDTERVQTSFDVNI